MYADEGVWLTRKTPGMLYDVETNIINIKKQNLGYYGKPKSPYELAMLFCMERLNKWLIENSQTNKTMQIHFEARGRNEDNELELEFRRICDNAAIPVRSGTDFSKIPYRIRFLDKKVNSTGLQLADLIARPIGLHVLRPGQKNQAFDIIKDKFITHGNGEYQGRGLKIFP